MMPECYFPFRNRNLPRYDGLRISWQLELWVLTSHSGSRAKILVRSDIICFLSDVLISSYFSDYRFKDLLWTATKFLGWLISAIEASNYPHASSPTAFLFWLLVAILRVLKKRSSEIREFIEELKFLPWS